MCFWQTLHTSSQKLMVVGFTSITRLNQCKPVWIAVLGPPQRKCPRRKLNMQVWDAWYAGMGFLFSLTCMLVYKIPVGTYVCKHTHIKNMLLHICIYSLNIFINCINNKYIYMFCKNGTLLFLNWNKNCRESRLKDKRILQILFAGRILQGVLSGKRKSAAAPENCSSCKDRDSIWLLHCCRDPLEGWFEWM